MWHALIGKWVGLYWGSQESFLRMVWPRGSMEAYVSGSFPFRIIWHSPATFWCSYPSSLHFLIVQLIVHDYLSATTLFHCRSFRVNHLWEDRYASSLLRTQRTTKPNSYLIRKLGFLQWNLRHLWPSHSWIGYVDLDTVERNRTRLHDISALCFRVGGTTNYSYQLHPTGND